MKKSGRVSYPYRKMNWVAIGMLLAFALCGCRQGEELPRTQPDKPRLISMAPSLTEIVFALGLGENLVGSTRYCDYPAEALQISRVGGLYDPNMEAIVGLRPDAVLLLDNNESLKKSLDALGIGYVATSNNTLEDVLAAFTILGERFNVVSAADSLLLDFRTRMHAIEAASLEASALFSGKEMRRPRVLISIGRTMGTGAITDAYIAGPSTFYSDLLQRVGGENAYQGKLAYPKITAEGLLRLNPDFIFDMLPNLEKKGLTLTQVKNQWAGLSDINAVRNHRVVIFPQSFTVIPGPRLMLLLEAMAASLYPNMSHTPPLVGNRSDG